MQKLSGSTSTIFCVLIVLLSMAIGACSTNKYKQFSSQVSAQKDINKIQAPTISTEGFEKVDVFERDIFMLSKAQQKDFIRYFNSPRNKKVRPHWRVVNYLEQFSKGFTYRGDTYTATEALEKQTGNCLSLAILSSAFAKLADLRYRYKRVFTEPVFQQYDDILLISSHLNLTIYDEARNESGFALAPAAVTIDYFKMPGSISTEFVSPNQVEIMYWHNLASEAILENNLDLAFAFALKAQELDSLHPETLNLIAILYKRRGQEEKAYALYEYMLAKHIYSFATLDNFSIMLRERGDFVRADALNLQTKDISEDNPYTWIHRGKQGLEQKDYRLAEQYFKQSAQKAPYLHEPHFYLAQVYVQQHKLAKAEQALRKAKELAYLPEDQKRYEAKLYSLSY